ncbi:MAG: hypothetical protein E4H23_05835 [Chrysiogenales bacterium]|nr:hypothetical protein [Candidatus Aminicenantes bacterium]TFG79436.1 MAG: hypothetical protein E4H23_05835 [Chrysiogenales bacterium]
MKLPALLLLLAVLLLTFPNCRNTEPQTDDPPDTVDPLAVDIAIFPADNPWNTDISAAAVHPDSAAFIASIGASGELHADFGTVWEGAPIGIPYAVVGGGQPPAAITYTAYGDESDPGPFPIPDDAPIEGGDDSDGDRHVIVIDRDRRMLYELYRAFKIPGGWKAESGAKWDLASNAVRPKYWTSADAAGLPVFPGLVRYLEVQQGEISHALRFTVARTQRGFIYPARHFASSSNDLARPPMGLRLRLKAGVDISGFAAVNQRILRALKKYGMIVADNGSDWYLSGAPDSHWDDDDLHELQRIRGRDFEAVYTGPIEH